MRLRFSLLIHMLRQTVDQALYEKSCRKHRMEQASETMAA